jgi:hypothetical protein
MTKNIYILIGVISHEGSDIIAAFNNQEDAERLAEECREYDKLVPEYPSLQSGDCSEWCKTREVWKANHPCGSLYYNYYEVEEVELK